ncbi:Transposase IS66 family protein [compost metagenome]
MLAQSDLVPEGSAIAKALDYSLKRWTALARYLEDGAVPIDNNAVENQIRPWALGRSNWLCVSRRSRHDDEMKTAA